MKVEQIHKTKTDIHFQGCCLHLTCFTYLKHLAFFSGNKDGIIYYELWMCFFAKGQEVETDQWITSQRQEFDPNQKFVNEVFV